MMEMTFKYTLDNVFFLLVVCILFKHVQTLNLIFLNSVFLVKFEYTLLHLKFYFNFSKSEVTNDTSISFQIEYEFVKILSFHVHFS